MTQSSNDYDRLARELYSDGRALEALAVVREGLRLYPVATDLLYAQVMCLAATHEYARVPEAYRRYKAMLGHESAADIKYAEALVALGHLDAARSVLLPLSDADLDLNEGLYALDALDALWLRRRADDMAEAGVRLGKKLLVREPDHPELEFRLHCWLARSGCVEGLDGMAHCVGTYTADIDWYLRYAHAQLNLPRDWERLIEACRLIDPGEANPCHAGMLDEVARTLAGWKRASGEKGASSVKAATVREFAKAFAARTRAICDSGVETLCREIMESFREGV